MLGETFKKVYAKKLELKVDLQTIACVRQQRPGDCRKEFQVYFLREITEHRAVRSLQKYQPPDT